MGTKITDDLALKAEFYGHLSCSNHEGPNASDTLNGTTLKLLQINGDQFDILAATDRKGSLELKLIKKRQ